MKTWPLAFGCLALLATAGCRMPPAIALLEQENRDLEDRVYELADLVDRYRQENDQLRERLGPKESGRGPLGLGLPRELTQPASGPAGGSEVPGLSVELEPPDVEVPSTGVQGEKSRGGLREQGGAEPSDTLPRWPGQLDEAPKWDASADAGAAPPPLSLPAEQTLQVATRSTRSAADNTRVAAIMLPEQLTGGCNLDGRAGDEGICVQIEPRDSAGQLVPAAAPVSVVVLDPSLSGEAARVARWDFTAEEVARRGRNTPHTQGIRLEMVWPGAPPVHDRLHLFVRYETDDGRKLQTDRAITIDVPRPDARGARSAERIAPMPESNQAASGWQGKPAAVTPLPPTEPLRTAQLPRPTPLPATASPESPPPHLSPASRPRPAWSPDRL